MRVLGHGGAIGAVFLLGLAHGVQAQDSTERNNFVARQLFQEGVEAARAHQWEQARDRFERSYEIAPRLLTLLNLAGAQRNTGHLVAAAESYRRFLRETSDGRYTRFRTAARRLLETLEERIPYARVKVSGMGPMDELELDGAPLASAALHEPIPVDPGGHTLNVKRGDQIIGARSFTLDESQSAEVALKVAAPAKDQQGHYVAQAPQQDQEKKRKLLSSPLFWTAVGVVAAGVAGTSYYFATRDNGAYKGSFGVITVP